MPAEITLEFLGEGKLTIQIKNCTDFFPEDDDTYFEYTFTKPVKFYKKFIENTGKTHFGIENKQTHEYILATVNPPYLEINERDGSSYYSETCFTESVMQQFLDYVTAHENQTTPLHGEESITFKHILQAPPIPLVGHSAPAAGGKRRKQKTQDKKHSSKKRTNKKKTSRRKH